MKTPNFDRLAGLYRWMEWSSFGPWLWRCRCNFLGELAPCRRALVLGDGDGRFTARLLRENMVITVDALDASAAMLGALSRRASRDAARLSTRQADLREWQPDPGGDCYDLAVTHFFLDCLTTEEVQALAGKLSRALGPGALWVVSEFAVPENWFGKVVARPVVSFLYWAFGWLTGLAIRRLPDHQGALRRAGFTLLKRRSFLGGLLASELWSNGTKNGC